MCIDMFDNVEFKSYSQFLYADHLEKNNVPNDEPPTASSILESPSGLLVIFSLLLYTMWFAGH